MGKTHYRKSNDMLDLKLVKFNDVTTSEGTLFQKRTDLWMNDDSKLLECAKGTLNMWGW